MKTKMYLMIVICASLIFVQHASAQCGSRYMNEVFSNYDTTQVIYSTPYSLTMDIYQPTGDTASVRPLIILAHGGSFISGTREDDVTVTQLCANFAKRGYVTASIDYRLGNAINMLDSTYAINEVMQSISDGKAAIRFFTKDAYTANTYKIDTSRIYIGGNSAGAIIYMQVGYIDSIGECSPSLQAAIDSNGGFEGNSGNSGYPTKFNAMINLAGGLNDPNFAGPGDKPSVNAQGDQDQTVPYDCGYPQVSGIPVTVRLCGLGALEPVYVANHIEHSSLVFPGDGHVPWNSDITKFNRVDSLITAFLYKFQCATAAAIQDIKDDADISLFPNPASNFLNVTSTQLINNIFVYDETGRLINQISHINGISYQINTAQFSRGVYFVKFDTGQNYSTVIKRVIIGK